MKTSILYLIVTLSISCHRLKELTVNEVTGTYITENNFHGVGAKLKIKKNETFEYSWRTGLIAGETYGTWEIKKSRLILNSNHQPSNKIKKNIEIIDEH